MHNKEKQEALDAAVLAAVRNPGPHPVHQHRLVASLIDQHRRERETRYSFADWVDKSLQRLRKRGLIRYAGQVQGWKPVTPEPKITADMV
jgi:hypothetical protein